MICLGELQHILLLSFCIIKVKAVNVDKVSMKSGISQQLKLPGRQGEERLEGWKGLVSTGNTVGLRPADTMM